MSIGLPTYLDVGEPCRRCRRPLLAADTDDGELIVVHARPCRCFECAGALGLAQARPVVVDVIRFCGECQGRRDRGRRFRLDQLGDFQP